MGNAFKQPSKRVEEALFIMLALILLVLGIAGFQALLKRNLKTTSTNLSIMPTEVSKKNLLTYIFSDLKLSCSPLIDHTEKGLWHGICRSVDQDHAKNYILSIKSTVSPKKFKGFKLAKEVFYVLTKKEEYLMGKHSALSISTFLLGGGTFMKVAKKGTNPIYLLGFGIGLAFLIDKNMQIEFKEIDSPLTAQD